MPIVKNHTARSIRTPSGVVMSPGQESEVTDTDMENRRLQTLMERGDLSRGGSNTPAPAAAPAPVTPPVTRVNTTGKTA